MVKVSTQFRNDDIIYDADVNIISKLKESAAKHKDIDYMITSANTGSVAVEIYDDESGVSMKTLNMRLICPYEIVLEGPDGCRQIISKIFYYLMGLVFKGQAQLLDERGWKSLPEDVYEYRLDEISVDKHWIHHKEIGDFIGLDILVRFKTREGAR